MEKCNLWGELKKSVKDKYKRSISNPTLVLYSFAAIILLGNLGFYIEVYNFSNSKTSSLEPMVKSLITFFPAVAIPACMQLNITEGNSKSEKALSFFVAVIITFLALGIGILPASLNNCWLLTICVLLSIFSYFIWLIINADNNSFKESEPEASVGGSVSNNLNGSLEGLQS